MKVGTDGVLLGSWTTTGNSSRILDVGSGSGLVSIMLAQSSAAIIDGVEIEKNACLQARKNATGSPWQNRINFYHDSIQHFSEITSLRYNLIASNPPYFKNSLKPAASPRSMARHNTELDYVTLLACSSKLLLPAGQLSIIIPAADQKLFTGLADFHRLQPSRLTWVRPAPGKAYSRCLMELTSAAGISCAENELIIRKDDLKMYSENYINLTRDFYLGF